MYRFNVELNAGRLANQFLKNLLKSLNSDWLCAFANKLCLFDFKLNGEKSRLGSSESSYDESEVEALPESMMIECVSI